MNEAQRAAFEAWVIPMLGDSPTWRESGLGELARQAWNAATLAERDRAAKVCEAIALTWQRPKGNYFEGGSRGSMECAAAIRDGV